MPCCNKQIPPPPPNANKLDPTKKPINKNCGPVTFNWVNPVIKTAQKRQAMYMCDVYPISEDLSAYTTGKLLTNQWNKMAGEYKQKLKKNPKAKSKGIITMLYRGCFKNWLAFYFTVPLTSLCSVCLPICLNKLTAVLVPQYFFNCQDLFSSNPTLNSYKYKDGLLEALKAVWGYLILVIVALFCQAMLQNISYHNSGRVMLHINTGLIDMLYQKILLLSDSTRVNSAGGNIINLLFTDTTKISLLFQFFPFVAQVPVDIIVYIIYLAAQVAPIALVGLLVILVIFPLMSVFLKQIFQLQRKIMAFRDVRIKKATEILNGIKVIKLFRLEQVQEARLKNARQKEMSQLFRFSLFMSAIALFAAGLSPLMSSICFIALTYTNQFDISSAFTAMFLYQYLGFSMVMLPMLMSFISDAMISSARICTFLTISEKQRGIVINVPQQQLMDPQGSKALEEHIDLNKEAIKVTGKPSFTWYLSEDKIAPPILDPFFKENFQKISQITKLLPGMKKQYQQLLNRTNLVISNYTQVTEQQISLLQDINTKVTPENRDTLDSICLQLDLPLISRLQSLQQYNPQLYANEKGDDQLIKLEKLFIHILTMQIFLDQAANKDVSDGPAVIKNLDLTINKGEIIGICGPVGQGKTSLFTSLLGEMRLTSEFTDKIAKYKKDQFTPMCFDYFDEQTVNAAINENRTEMISDPAYDPEIPHVYINGSLSYFQQNSAILSRSVRDNITFGQQFNQQKYSRIVQICCLLDDFKILPKGDQTIIGGKGVTLSGGQKARVALARAIYADPDIILLDDPLSAVDSHVGKTIFQEAIMGYLKSRGTTVLLASHQTQYFSDCDRVIQIVDGEIAHFDTPANVIAAGAKIAGLTSESSQHKDTSQGLASVPVGQATGESDQTTLLAGDSVHEGEESGNDIAEAEGLSGTGVIKCTTYCKWLSQGSRCICFIMIITFLIFQAITQYQTTLITAWTQDDYGWTKKDGIIPNYLDIKVNCPDGNQNAWCTNLVSFLQSVKVPEPKNSKYLFSATLQCYDKDNISYTSPKVGSSKRYLWLYLGLTFATMLFNYICNVSLAGFCISIAKNMHLNMIRSIIRTKMSFFDVTSQGKILNRMSRDSDSLDMNIQRFFQQVVTTALYIVGMLITIACVNYPTLSAIIPAVIIFFIVFLQFKNVFPLIKRLEAVSRSPVYNACQETIDNLVVVRAFGLEKSLTTQLRQDINTFGSLFYQQFAVMRWIIFRLNVLAAFLAFAICIISVLLSPTDPSISQYTGVIVSQAFGLTNTLFQFVMGSVSLDGEMASTERILEYQSLPGEGIYEDPSANLRPDWPSSNSKIQIQNLQLRYRPELDLVLKGLTFDIQPREHVGIVGRTGAGKSSISVSLYRLAQPDEGSHIIVDGVDIMNLGLHQARKAFTIIPQDPFLFSGTLRQCLCPYSQAEAEGSSTEGLQRLTDEQIWMALEHVQMKQFFEKQPGRLECKIAENGDNLSAGQKQLVCVARALLREASCVILDEATASIDRETDQKIQETIRTAFAHTTVLSIAHRLDTIIDFDRILVMDAGNVAEFDTPANLLRNPDGIFSKLVSQTGPAMAETLHQMALAAEERRKQERKAGSSEEGDASVKQVVQVQAK